MADTEEQRARSPSPKEAPAQETAPEVELPELSIGDSDSKAEIRTKVWDYLETNNLSSFPRPVKNRIPNYKGSAAACDKVTELDAFRDANTIKINPDKPQEQARFRTLETGKTLLVPTPRLKKGLFNKIQPQDTKKSTLKFCSTSQGVKLYSSPLELNMKVKVDLVVIGSVAVSTSGWRIGKGEGFADLEYGMMASVGAVNDNTLVVTAVHDCQVMDLPDDIFGRHDVTIDYICTPTRVIECSRRPKPQGIYWSLLSLEKFLQIPILKILRDQEKAEGKDVTLEDASEEEVEDALAKLPEQEDEPPERERDPRRRNRRNRYGRGGRAPRGTEEGRDVNGISSGMDGGEHADGEDSPSGEKRKFNNRRRRIRNRRRNRDSERLNSEGEPMSPVPPHDSQGNRYEDRDGDDRGPPRRRQRRFRRAPGDRRERLSGTENEERDHSMEDQRNADSQGRRPNPRRRNRQRRSEGDRHDMGERDGDGNARRPPRKYGYQNRRPRNDEGRRYDDEEHSDTGNPERDGGSPGGERRRRERPRRNNNLPTVYVGSLPKALRVSAFKKQVRDMDVNPLRVLWRGSNGHVFLIFETMDEAEAALAKLDHLSVNEKEVRVAMANRTERRRQGGDYRADDGGAGDFGQASHVDKLAERVDNMALDSKIAANKIVSSDMKPAQDRSINEVSAEV